MVATINWLGAPRLATGSLSTETWGTLKLAGSGGTPGAAVADGALEGTDAVTVQVNKQRVVLYFDNATGLNFDTTYADDMVYINAAFLAPGLLLSQASGGFGIFLGTSTTDYALYYIYGNDNYTGGFKRLVIDPRGTASAIGGAGLTTSSVRYFGVFADVGGTTARFDNLICDNIDVGRGITVTGTSTTDDLKADLIADEETNRYGIVTALNDTGTSLGLNGKLLLGSTGAGVLNLTDNDMKLFVESPTYYDGTSVVRAVPERFYEIITGGNSGTSGQIVQFGEKVGTGDTATGRNGLTVVGNDLYKVGLNFTNNNLNTLNLYGCNFENCTGKIQFGFNSGSPLAWEVMGTNFTGCATVEGSRDTSFRNCNFVAANVKLNTAETSSFTIQSTVGSSIINYFFDAPFTPLDEDVNEGSLVQNITDGSQAVFLTGSAYTDGLTGGTDNEFQLGDSITIAANNNIAFKDEGSDIKNCNFIANTTAAGTLYNRGYGMLFNIDYTGFAGPDLDGLNFVGNDKDILYVASLLPPGDTPGTGSINFNLINGTNVTTSTIDAPTGDTVSVTQNATVNVSIVDSDGIGITGVLFSMYEVGTNVELFNDFNVGAPLLPYRFNAWDSAPADEGTVDGTTDQLTFDVQVRGEDSNPLGANVGATGRVNYEQWTYFNNSLHSIDTGTASGGTGLAANESTYYAELVAGPAYEFYTALTGGSKANIFPDTVDNRQWFANTPSGAFIDNSTYLNTINDTIYVKNNNFNLKFTAQNEVQQVIYYSGPLGDLSSDLTDGRILWARQTSANQQFALVRLWDNEADALSDNASTRIQIPSGGAGENIHFLQKYADSFSFSVSGPFPREVYWRARKSSALSTKYVNISGTATIDLDGLNLTIRMREDTIADPTI